MAASAPPPRVRYELRGTTAVLTLDHPPVNVLSREVLDELVAQVDRAEADPRARTIVLASAAERAFAAGANIREMAPMGPREARVHGARGQGATRRLERCPLPVIAAVHGVCLGGGCEVALACDGIVASEDAFFGQPEINLGVMPGWGGTRRLPRRIGAVAARRWILGGAAVPATEAHGLGLVDRVVPRAELMSTALAWAEELATRSATALAAAKFALLHALDPEIDEGLAYELDLWAKLFGTAEQKAGMAAFIEKRPYRAPAERNDWAEISRPFPWRTERSPRAPKPTSGKRKR